jgi:predicted tellurium resistance membrane protein TerC
MIAVAGGILLALLVVILLIGFLLMFRDIGRFLWRHKSAVVIVVVAFGIWATFTVAGLYSKPYSPPYVQR